MNHPGIQPHVSEGNRRPSQPPENLLPTNPETLIFYRQAFGGAWMTQALAVAAELGIADQLLRSTQTGEPGFHKRYGLSFFQHMTRHPDRHAIYDEAMQGVHGAETEPMMAAYDFSRHATVADIGGGNGSTLAAILKRHPLMQGILFDLPDVANRAGDEFVRAGVIDRCRIEGGDFFAAVPAGAEAYVLRHVIHDWQDDDAVAILRKCREALPRDGRVLVVEHVLPPGNAPGFGKWLDLMMLLVAGRERTEAEFRRLFEAAGLRLERVLPTSAEVGTLEGVAALRETPPPATWASANGRGTSGWPPNFSCNLPALTSQESA